MEIFNIDLDVNILRQPQRLQYLQCVVFVEFRYNFPALCSTLLNLNFVHKNFTSSNGKKSMLKIS